MVMLQDLRRNHGLGKVILNRGVNSHLIASKLDIAAIPEGAHFRERLLVTIIFLLSLETHLRALSSIRIQFPQIELYSKKVCHIVLDGKRVSYSKLV